MRILTTFLGKTHRNPSYFGCFGRLCYLWWISVGFPRKVVRIRMNSRNSLYNAPAKKVSNSNQRKQLGQQEGKWYTNRCALTLHCPLTRRWDAAFRWQYCCLSSMYFHSDATTPCPSQLRAPRFQEVQASVANSAQLFKQDSGLRKRGLPNAVSSFSSDHERWWS